MNSKILILDNFKALGTGWWIEIFQRGEAKFDVEKIKIRLEEEIKNFENKYTRFKNTSLLSELNTKKEIKFDKEFFEILTLADKFNKNSGGIFNVFIKEKLEEKGYGKEVVVAEISKKDFSEISATIQNDNKIILKGNFGIDLGGIGKGYLIDKLSNILQNEFNLEYFLINGGGDIYVTSNYGEDIQFFLEHPINEGEYIYKIKIKNKAFCVSSSFKRMWNKEGKEVNHFISEGEVWATSYVVADRTVIADVFATVSCILSSDDTKLKNIYKNFDVEYLVINEVGKIFKSEGFPKLE